MESRKTLQQTDSHKRAVFFYAKSKLIFIQKGGELLSGNIKKQNMDSLKAGNQYMQLVPRFAFIAFLAVALIAVSASPVFAAGIFDTAKNAMQTVYKDVAGIATVAAVVCAAVCLFLMNFSKSGRTVDESRSWLKRIIICWAALMTMGAIVTYFESIIPKSMFGG